MPKKNDRVAFWNDAWRNLFHGLGMVAVVLSAAGAGVLAWMAFFPSVSTDGERKAQRELFQKVVREAAQPCAVKKEGAKWSNLDGCTLFRLRPGMAKSDVLNVINSSGYFSTRTEFRDPVLGKEYCGKKDKDNKDSTCKHYVHMSNEAFTVSVHFDDRWEAESVMLIFGQDAHPYSDLDSTRAILVKLIGPPDDRSLPGHETWGDDVGAGKRSIRAYIHDNRLWVIFEVNPAKR